MCIYYVHADTFVLIELNVFELNLITMSNVAPEKLIVFWCLVVIIAYLFPVSQPPLLGMCADISPWMNIPGLI